MISMVNQKVFIGDFRAAEFKSVIYFGPTVFLQGVLATFVAKLMKVFSKFIGEPWGPGFPE